MAPTDDKRPLPQSSTLGPKSLADRTRTLLRFGPNLVESSPLLWRTLWGQRRLSPRLQVAVQLRLAHLLGSRRGSRFWTTLGRQVGLGQRDLDAAAEGEIDALPHDLGRVVAWTTAVVEAKGEMPLEWPAAARDMTMLEREQVLALARLVLVLKSIVPPPFG